MNELEILYVQDIERGHWYQADQFLPEPGLKVLMCIGLRSPWDEIWIDSTMWINKAAREQSEAIAFRVIGSIPDSLDVRWQLPELPSVAPTGKQCTENCNYKAKKNAQTEAAIKNLVDEIGIFSLLDGTPYSCNDTRIQEIRQKALDCADQVVSLLGLHVKSTQTGIEIVNKIVKKLGFKTRIIRREGTRGNQTRIYVIQPVTPTE